MQVFLAVEEHGQAQLSAAGGREGLALTALNSRQAEGEKGGAKGGEAPACCHPFPKPAGP